MTKKVNDRTKARKAYRRLQSISMLSIAASTAAVLSGIGFNWSKGG